MTLLLAVLVGFAQDATVAQPPQRPAPTDAQRERARRIYLPSAPHDQLARLAGTWNQTTRYGSGDGTVEAHGRVVNRVILGGRFVLSEGTASQPNGGLTVGTLLILGFDGRSSEHTVIVLDTLGTYFVTAAGANDEPTTRLLMRGETREGAGTKRFDVALEWIDEDTYETRITFHLPGRPPVPAVSSVHRRVR